MGEILSPAAKVIITTMRAARFDVRCVIAAGSRTIPPTVIFDAAPLNDRESWTVHGSLDSQDTIAAELARQLGIILKVWQ